MTAGSRPSKEFSRSRFPRLRSGMARSSPLFGKDSRTSV